jgi:DNA-directed RNA polymerase specialized sigma24 family protein
MDQANYLKLQRLAMRLSRRADEAEDLLHDALVAGLEAGRGDAAWLSGVLRNKAALSARGAVRRRHREELVAVSDIATAQAAPIAAVQADPRPLLRQLPPAARRLAVLVLHGLDAQEIRWILGISQTAFRQRLTRIRRALAALSVDQREAVIATSPLHQAGAIDAMRPFGLLRRALQQAMQQSGDGLGTHDCDGHLLIIRRRAHTSPPGGNHAAGLPRNEE